MRASLSGRFTTLPMVTKWFAWVQMLVFVTWSCEKSIISPQQLPPMPQCIIGWAANRFTLAHELFTAMGIALFSSCLYFNFIHEWWSLFKHIHLWIGKEGQWAVHFGVVGPKKKVSPVFRAHLCFQFCQAQCITCWKPVKLDEEVKFDTHLTPATLLEL